MGVRDQTRFNQLVDQIKPLADWLEQFKPSCNRISIAREDMRLIQKRPELAKTMGFRIEGGLITWRGGKFEIKEAP